ncbi:MAG TPA: 2Fe-2S iron-sulfur cluster-binding protein [Aurantimonas sp.]
MKRWRVTLANRNGRVLDVGEDQPILDAAEAAGIVLPVACRYGGCITCAGRLISGKVRQPKGTALNRRQSVAGYILLCVARPRSDCVIAVGVESHDELYRNPFADFRPSGNRS